MLAADQQTAFGIPENLTKGRVFWEYLVIAASVK
jgi:hypothetical protein